MVRFGAKKVNSRLPFFLAQIQRGGEERKRRAVYTSP